ncbi:unnamed protein product, partial [Allacma fusca]
DNIVRLATEGAFKGKTFHDVAEYVDTFGHRITGSESLEKSIDYIEEILRQNGATNIQSEEVGVADWRRRTLRLAFWTAEEYGYWGSAQYIKNHANEFGNLSAVLEADYSCLASTGLVYYGVPGLACILEEVINLVGLMATGFRSPANLT